LYAILEENKGEAHLAPSQVGMRLHEYVQKWSTEQMEQIGTYLLEWNTNSRTSFVSQTLLQALVATKGVACLLKIKSMRTQIQAFLAYSERHFQRVDKLCQASYVLEYMSTLMSVLPEEQETETNSTSGELHMHSRNTNLLANAISSTDDSPLDIFGSDSKSQNIGTEDSESDSDSDVSASVARAASFSGMVVGSSDDESEEEVTEKVVAKKARTSKSGSSKAATPAKTQSKGSGTTTPKTSSQKKGSNSSTKKRKAR
jgi:hypothetical protein